MNAYNRMYSELISTSIAEGGPFASRTSFVKLLRCVELLGSCLILEALAFSPFIPILMCTMHRSVKRETLKLIETFLDKAEDQPHIGKQFVPPMMDPVLGDYARNLPDARESEVLSLFATIINKYYILFPLLVMLQFFPLSDSLHSKDINKIINCNFCAYKLSVQQAGKLSHAYM